jgi:hypothetical protein
VASQWNAAYRFVGLASDDASFLDDYRNNLGEVLLGLARTLERYGPRTAPGGDGTVLGAIAASFADPSGLGKAHGDYFARLHAAVANLSPPTSARRRGVRK